MFFLENVLHFRVFKFSIITKNDTIDFLHLNLFNYGKYFSIILSFFPYLLGPSKYLLVLRTFWKTKNCYAEDVLKTSWRHVLKTSWRHLKDMSWRRLEDMSWRRLEDMSCRRLEDMSWRSLEEISWGHLEDTMKTNKVLTGDICI